MANETRPLRQEGIRARGIYSALACIRPALFAVENCFWEGAHVFGANRFTRRGGVCRTTRDIYEPIVYQLGYQEEFVKYAAACLPAISFSDCGVRSASGYARCPIIVLLVTGPGLWCRSALPALGDIARKGRQRRHAGGAK